MNAQILREGFKKKKYGIFQTSSDPSQPGDFRPEVWKKKKVVEKWKVGGVIMKKNKFALKCVSGHLKCF